jgi:pyruvate dehydrogenase E2 component (dihydrolipoamide acetyltransferase)
VLQQVKLAKIGLTMESGTIVRWFKQEGDFVKEGEPFFEVETDKATQTVESFVTGYVRRILAKPGDEVPVNAVIALVGALEDELP